MTRRAACLVSLVLCAFLFGSVPAFAEDVTVEWGVPDDQAQEPIEWNRRAYGAVGENISVAVLGTPAGGDYTLSKLSGPGTLDFTGDPQYSLQVTASKVGVYTMKATYSYEGDSEDDVSGSVIVFSGNVDVGADDGAEDDPEELTVGAFIDLETDWVPVELSVQNVANLPSSKMELAVTSGGSHIEIWSATEGGTKLYPNNWHPPDPNPLEFDGASPVTVYLKPLSASTSVRDVTLSLTVTATEEGHIASPWTAGDSAKVTVYEAVLESVTFTSDHDVLTDYDTDYAGDGGTVYSPSGWMRATPPVSNPISHNQGDYVTANVVLRLKPGQMDFDLEGACTVSPLNFEESSTSTGQNQTVAVTSATALPAVVDTIEDAYVSWTPALPHEGHPDVEIELGDSGGHTIYVTWDDPAGSVATLKRIRSVCEWADGANSEAAIAALLQTATKENTAFGGGDTDGWPLFDGGSGECHEQASAMEAAFELIGAGPAYVEKVFASAEDDGGEGHCIDPDGEDCVWLFLDFDTGPGYAWNAFEGCCVAAGRFWAITPKLDATNDYTMLLALPCQQYWCLTNDKYPGEPGWQIEAVGMEESKP